jgi:hypothetical protein
VIKRLEEQSKYEKFDLDHDGIVTDEEMARAKEMLELELREEKFEQQQKMAWIAMATMFVFTVVLFSPIISEARVDALADLLGLFYIAQAGVVGTYMGAQALMHKK